MRCTGKVLKAWLGIAITETLLLRFKSYSGKININIINKYKESVDLCINTEEVS